MNVGTITGQGYVYGDYVRTIIGIQVYVQGSGLGFLAQI